MKSEIALFGTSADPPTYGHQALLKGLSKLFPKVVTWASNNPMKNHGATLEQRSMFLNLLVKDIAIPNIQLRQELSSPWAIETIEKARVLWPTADLKLIIGSDLAGQIPDWYQAKKLLHQVKIGIAPREGWPINQAKLKILETLGADINFLPLEIPKSSSSTIRKKPHRSQIPASILPMIINKKLYGISEESL